MTDNFKLIKDFIQSQWGGQFDSFTNVFYTIEIIGRAKDNTHIQSHKFKTYYIRTIEDFDKYENEIKLLCDTLQMRAYISVNHKSMKHVTLNTMAEYANRIAQEIFSKRIAESQDDELYALVCEKRIMKVLAEQRGVIKNQKYNRCVHDDRKQDLLL